MMKRAQVYLCVLVACCSGMASMAMAQQSTAEAPPMQLPPGWTMEDMQAMMAAATPGEMHKHLQSDVGKWTCQTKSWMGPNTDPIESTGTSEVTPLMDGRFVKCEMKGEMPGMGPFNGLAIYGFDNITQKFTSVWLDNFATGMMKGTGKLSKDGKTLSWEYEGYCPLTKKPIVMREVETTIDANTKKLEMFGPDPKTGKEFKMMEIALKRS
jgi:hypothetical protein